MPIMSNKEKIFRRNTVNQAKPQDIVDSDACGSASGGSTSLDNRFAVDHTTHNTTTAILERKTGKEVKAVSYHWGKIIVVSGEK